MIRISFRLIKPDHVDEIRAWMDELMRRPDEVRETFRQEGVSHEIAYLLETAEGVVLVYGAEAEDPSKVYDIVQHSTLAIDHEHIAVMERSVARAADAQLVYECHVDPAKPMNRAWEEQGGVRDWRRA